MVNVIADNKMFSEVKRQRNHPRLMSLGKLRGGKDIYVGKKKILISNIHA